MLAMTNGIDAVITYGDKSNVNVSFKTATSKKRTVVILTYDENRCAGMTNEMRASTPFNSMAWGGTNTELEEKMKALARGENRNTDSMAHNMITNQVYPTSGNATLAITSPLINTMGANFSHQQVIENLPRQQICNVDYKKESSSEKEERKAIKRERKAAEKTKKREARALSKSLRKKNRRAEKKVEKRKERREKLAKQQRDKEIAAAKEAKKKQAKKKEEKDKKKKDSKKKKET